MKDDIAYCIKRISSSFFDMINGSDAGSIVENAHDKIGIFNQRIHSWTYEFQARDKTMNSNALGGLQMHMLYSYGLGVWSVLATHAIGRNYGVNQNHETTNNRNTAGAENRSNLFLNILHPIITSYNYIV